MNEDGKLNEDGKVGEVMPLEIALEELGKNDWELTVIIESPEGNALVERTESICKNILKAPEPKFTKQQNWTHGLIVKRKN
jgi:hypothetical protein